MIALGRGGKTLTNRISSSAKPASRILQIASNGLPPVASIGLIAEEEVSGGDVVREFFHEEEEDGMRDSVRLVHSHRVFHLAKLLLSGKSIADALY